MKYYLQTLFLLMLFISCSKEIEPENITNYKLEVLVTPIEGGTVFPSNGSYPKDTKVTLEAVPSPEYIFKEWSGSVVGTTNPITVIMNKDVNISVVFEKIKSTEELLNNYSIINKKTSWYTTNSSFDELFDVAKSKYWGFEILSNGELKPFVPGTWSENNNYYFYSNGQYLYSDLNGDGKKDLFSFYHRTPWPMNTQGLNLFSEFELTPDSYEIELGLIDVSKCVLSDLNNDNINEIVLFGASDATPYDAIEIFDVKSKKYEYLNKETGYFHGGSVGDINNDGFSDILGYDSGWTENGNSPKPVLYLNKGDGSFELRTEFFSGFSGTEPFYTVEFFDINKDNHLDLFLADGEQLYLCEQKNGIYDYLNKTDIPIPSGNQVMGINFFDINNDNETDIITIDNTNNYNGYALNIYTKVNQKYVNVTSDYVDFSAGDGFWISKLRLFDYDKDGDIDLIADGIFLPPNEMKIIYWKNDNGRFKRIISN